MRQKLKSKHKPVWVAISVVVTQQIIFSGLWILQYSQRLINRGQEILNKLRNQIDDIRQVLLSFLRWQTSHQIKGSIKLFVQELQQQEIILNAICKLIQDSILNAKCTCNINMPFSALHRQTLLYSFRNSNKNFCKHFLDL